MGTRVSVAETIVELSRRIAKLKARHAHVSSTLLAVVLVSSAVLSPEAHANPRREWLGARPVERPMVLPRGWSEAAVGWNHHRADGGFDASGRRDEWTRPMLMDALTTSLRVGLVSRVEVFASLKTVRLTADDQSLLGIGAATLGARTELWASALPMSSLTAEMAYQLPIGTRMPSATQSGAPVGSDLAVGTGASEFLPAVRFRRQFGALRLQTGLFADVSLPTGPRASDGRSDWADGVGMDGGALLQVGPVAISTRVSAMRRGDDRLDGVRVPSAGWHVSMRGGAIVSVNRSVDIALEWQQTFLGRPTRFSGAPDLSPTHGPGQHLCATFRW